MTNRSIFWGKIVWKCCCECKVKVKNIIKLPGAIVEYWGCFFTNGLFSEKRKYKKGFEIFSSLSLFDCEIYCEIYVNCYVIRYVIYRFAAHKQTR
jgi:hypothetical protein